MSYDYDSNVYDDNWDYPLRLVQKALTTKEKNMKTNEQLMAERDALLLKAAELEKRVTQRETYGEDPFKNGDMLKIMITYGTSDVSYTYAGIKIRNRFYLSGKVQSQRTFLNPRGVADDSTPPLNVGWTYDHLVAWLAAGDASVWIVEKLKKVF